MNELIELWIKVTKERELEELPKEMNDLYDYTVKLQQERDLYKKVIEEVRKYIEREDICIDIRDNELNYISTNELLQILDKGESNE